MEEIYDLDKPIEGYVIVYVYNLFNVCDFHVIVIQAQSVGIAIVTLAFQFSPDGMAVLYTTPTCLQGLNQEFTD